MSQQVTPIVRELHDEPHIEGWRITVQLIKECVEDRGLNPRTVADRYELDIAEVYHALAYYYDYLDECVLSNTSASRPSTNTNTSLQIRKLSENVEPATRNYLQKLGL